MKDKCLELGSTLQS